MIERQVLILTCEFYIFWLLSQWREVTGMTWEGANLILYWSAKAGSAVFYQIQLLHELWLSELIGNLTFITFAWNIYWNIWADDYSFVCNWRMLVWHIGGCQLGGGLCKSSGKNPFCISHRTTCATAVDDHILLLNDFNAIARTFGDKIWFKGVLDLLPNCYWNFRDDFTISLDIQFQIVIII